MKNLIYIIFILFVVAGCSDEDVNKDNQAEDIEINLYSVDELNETVWDDSKEVFEILVKDLEDVSTTDEEREKVLSYFKKYRDSKYRDMDGAESSLVNNLFVFSLNIMTRYGVSEEQQKERAKAIEEYYMILEQMFNEYKKLN